MPKKGAKGKVKKKSGTKTTPKKKVKKKKSIEKIKIEKKKIEMKETTIALDLRPSISKEFFSNLREEFDYAHVVPIELLICTCGPRDENIRTYLFEYDGPKAFGKKRVDISMSDNATEEELNKIIKCLPKRDKDEFRCRND